MEIHYNSIIGEVVAYDFHTASIFSKHQIDFCCNGKRSLAEACNNAEDVTSQLVEELKESLQKTEGKDSDFNTWPLDLLIDYIEKIHHRYVRNKIKEITPYLDKVCKVHGSNHPELHQIRALFFDGAEELTQHLYKEEIILFPYIRHMCAGELAGAHCSFGTVDNPIRMMEHEHDVEGNRFRTIRELSHQFTPPADACTTYKVCFSMLEEFEKDLHKHIHLENNILFPAAIKMEKEMTL